MVDYNKGDDKAKIFQRIPHRPPFLWVDKILALGPQSIETEKFVPPDLDVFKGHYPDYPILPGALMCEAIFQAGAILLSEIINNDGEAGDRNVSNGVPVLTRILNAKFKRQIKPGDTLNVQVEIVENLGSAWFLKGKAYVDGKVAVRVEFGCSLADIVSE